MRNEFVKIKTRRYRVGTIYLLFPLMLRLHRLIINLCKILLGLPRREALVLTWFLNSINDRELRLFVATKSYLSVACRA